MNPDPRIQELTKKTAKKIRSLTDTHNAQLEQVYQDYQQKAAAIRAESSTDGIAQAPALPSEPSPQSNPH